LQPPQLQIKIISLFEHYTWEYGTKIAINFNDDKIVRIIDYENSSSFATSKNIQVGDSKETIIQTYGNNDYKRESILRPYYGEVIR